MPRWIVRTCEHHNVLTRSLIEYSKLKSQLDIDVHRDSILRTRATLVYVYQSCANEARCPQRGTKRSTCKREFGRIKGENFCRIGRAGWIYLIYGNVRKSRWILLGITDRLLYIYIYMYKTALNRVKCNRHFVKHQIYTVSNLSIAFPSARFLHDISNKHVENYK